MGEGLQSSRFSMWRAVFAMAHADHEVSYEEKMFMQKYFEHVPFSSDQIQVLRQDIETPQSVEEMFDGISEPEDRAEFFQFARMLCYSDGDFDEQEKIIKERLKDLQLNNLDHDTLEKELALSRDLAELQREKEDNEFRDTTQSLLGLGSFLRGMGQGLKDIVMD
jgi:uncharacterized membrane protein YebE (DUF533 family)